MTSKLLPGSTGLPFVGETVPFLSDMISFVNNRVTYYGRIFRTHVLRNDTAILCDYDDVLSALCEGSERLSASAAYAEFLSVIYPRPNLLLATDGSSLRVASEDVLQKALHDMLPDLVAPVHEVISASLDEIHPPCHKRIYATLRATCESALMTALLGRLTSAEMHRVRTLASTHFAGVIAAPISVRALGKASARSRALDAHSELHEYAKTQIRSKSSANNKTSKPNVNGCTSSNLSSNLSVLDIAANAVVNGHLSLDEAAQIIIVLLSPVANKALAATATATLLETRARGADAWRKLRIAYRKQNPLTDTSHVDDIDAAIMEALRMAPPIVGAMRIAQHDDAIEGIRGGWRVWSSFLHANTDASVYQDPFIFSPSRWQRNLSEQEPKSQGVCPFAWPSEGVKNSVRIPLSFGEGIRRCKGRDLAWLIMREVVTGFVDRFDVSDDVSEWNKQLRYFPVTRSVQDKLIMVFKAEER